MISRACTATALNFESHSWLIDCAEGTQTQILRSQNVRVARIDRVFITHMHVDHVMGLIPLIRSAMYGGTDSPFSPGGSSHSPIRMHVYGPPGIRKFVRFNLQITEVGLFGKFAVHELLQMGEAPSTGCKNEDMHENEVAGQDLIAGEDGLWRNILEAGEWSVDAGPVTHRTRSLGYVFRERDSSSIGGAAYIAAIDANDAQLRANGHRNPRSLLSVLLKKRQPVSLPDGTVLEPPPLDIPGRKIVILGDTSNSDKMIPIAMDASALVHECTNAYIPRNVANNVRGMNGRGTEEIVKAKAISRGHSTANMAGEFAKKIRARRLYMNHFSTRFSPGGQSPHPGIGRGKPSSAQKEAALVMAEIERQASEAWGLGNAVAAKDLQIVDIQHHEVVLPTPPSTSFPIEQKVSTSTQAVILDGGGEEAWERRIEEEVKAEL